MARLERLTASAAPPPALVAIAAEATSVLFKDLEPLPELRYVDLYTPVYMATVGDQWPYANTKAVYLTVADRFQELAKATVKNISDLSEIKDLFIRFDRRRRVVCSVFAIVDRNYARGAIPKLWVCAMREFCRAVVAKFGADRLATAPLPPCMASPAFAHAANGVEVPGLIVVDGKTVGVREVAKMASLLLVKEILPFHSFEACTHKMLRLLCRFAFEVRKRQERIQGLLARWRRLSFNVGKIVVFTTGIFTEVHYRPSNQGFVGCKRSYEVTLGHYELAGDAKRARGA